MILLYILLFTFIASILSLFLVAILLLKQKLIKKISFHLVSFAAGALLATAFTDTMPEAVKESTHAYILVTVFIALFFIIEKVFLDIHHHNAEEGKKLRLPIPLLMFGDGLHNFIDGVSIAATFLVSIPVGIITSFAVFMHEIPHELGDFGILLHAGYSRKKVLSFNILTGLTAFMGAILGFLLHKYVNGILPVFLAMATANFLYLSLSDLLPEIHHGTKGKSSIYHVAAFLSGILLVVLLTSFIKE